VNPQELKEFLWMGWVVRQITNIISYFFPSDADKFLKAEFIKALIKVSVE
jgi:hypothetical protein